MFYFDIMEIYLIDKNIKTIPLRSIKTIKRKEDGPDRSVLNRKQAK